MPKPFIRLGSLTSWSLEILGGANQSLADWGLQNCRLFHGSQQIGQFAAIRPVQKIEDASICDFGTRIILRDHVGRVRFIGKRVETEQQTSGIAEHQLYRFVNPWWDLIKRVYHRTWTTWVQSGGNATQTQSFNPHVILNVGRSVGQEITDIIQYAANEGVPIQAGTIDAPVFPPPDEVHSRDCASIITQLLAYAPDNVCFFEYPQQPGADPRPIFHCRRAADLEAKTLALPSVAEDFTIRARHEDLAPAVAIRYERVDQLTVDGVTSDYPVIVTDIYPPTATGREERAFSATVQLASYSRSVTTAQLICASLPASFEIGSGALDFWQRLVPLLADDRTKQQAPLITANSFLRTAERLGDAQPDEVMVPHQRYLIAGEIAPWMKHSNGVPLAWQKQVLSAAFNYDLFIDADAQAQVAEAGRIENMRNQRHYVKLTATDAPAGVSTYTRVTTEGEGEQPPVGLAQYLYNILSVLGYSGQHRRIQSDCDGSVLLGHLLNISGGAPEWAAMGSLVQSTDEHIDDGETIIQFGVAPNISLGRILELLRNARTRRRWTAPEQQSDGDITGSGSTEFGRVTADSNTVDGDRNRTLFAVSDGSKRITSDISGGNHAFLMRNEDDVAKYIQAQLDNNNARQAWVGAGGQVNLRTEDCLYLGVPRSVAIKAVKSCDPSDPTGSSWVRLVLCSDRIRIA